MTAVAMPKLTVMLRALGHYLLATHQHERQPDPARPWLLVEPPPCAACQTLRAALEDESRPSGIGEASP